MGPLLRSVEREIALIAGRQHGVVTRRQLLDAGLGPDQIRRRVRLGALLAQHRGVYRVGHRAPSLEADYLAAVLACGDGALLHGRAAGHLWGVVKGAAPPAAVIAPREHALAGVDTRRWRRLHRQEATTWRGIPITSLPRTLVDLAALLDEEDLALACHHAGARFGTTPRDVDRVLARRPSAPGTRALRRVLHGDVHVALSRLERAFLQLMKRHGLPLPVTNRVASGRRVDCRWPPQRLTVELDSYRFHSSRHAWEQDRRREREARRRGDEFRRYTYGDVLEHPADLLRELTALLADHAPG